MANEHMLRALLRRVAPYALRALDQELERAEKRLKNARLACERLAGDCSARRVAGALKRRDAEAAELDRLERLHDELKAVRRG